MWYVANVIAGADATAPLAGVDPTGAGAAGTGAVEEVWNCVDVMVEAAERLRPLQCDCWPKLAKRQPFHS